MKLLPPRLIWCIATESGYNGYMRKLFILALGFTLGYFTREYMGKYNITSATIVEQTTGIKTSPRKTTDTSVLIVYDKNRFTPNEVTMRRGARLTIRNDSDALMWLSSDYTKLNTPRGYARSEQVMLFTDQAGVFSLTNKHNLDAKATITITD